jgi:hypothetical protein
VTSHIRVKKTSQKLWMSSDERVGVMGPRGCFVVDGAGLEAAVQDPDEPVGDLAQCAVVAGVSGTLLVVVGAGTGRDADRSGGLGKQGVDEPVVVDEAGRDDLLLA